MMEDFKKIKEEVCDETVHESENINHQTIVDMPEYVNVSTLIPLTLKQMENIFDDNKPLMKTKNSIGNAIGMVIKQELPNQLKSKRKRKKYIPKPKTCKVCSQQLSGSKSLTLHMRVHNDERPYKCEICGKSFRQKGGMTAHMVTHSKQKPYPCPDCDGSFTTKSSLKRHQKRIHESGKTFDCKFCPKTFHNILAYRAHRKEKHPDLWEPRECQECGKMLDSSAISRRHYRTVHMKKEIGKILINNKHCILCGEEFDTINLYITHKYNHLQYTKEELRIYSIDRIYPCKICDGQFSSLDIIVAHMANHMQKTNKCEICNEEFSYFLYNKHWKQVHDQVTCRTCEEVFQGRMALRSHRAKEHYSKQPCHICKKVLSSKRQLQTHLHSFHQEGSMIQRNHRCVYCNQLFLTRGNLSRHVVRYHSKNLKRSCDICNLKFVYYYELTQHMQRKHFKLLNRIEFSCHICSKTFRDRRVLTRHVYRHNHMKYECNRCHKILNDKRNYIVHMMKKVCVPIKIESKVICKECDKEYPNNWYFRRHLLIHSIKYKTCRFCKIEYENVESIKKHFLKNHSTEQIFHCDYCNVNICTFKEMMKHRKSHGHKKKFLTSLRLIRKTKNNKRIINTKDDHNEGSRIACIKEELEIKTEPNEEGF